MTDPKEPTTKADPQVVLAAERTLLAWIRTGIAFMGFGFVVARFGLFLRELALVGGRAEPMKVDGSTIGIGLVGAGVVVNVWSSVRHVRTVRRLREGKTDIGAVSPVAVAIATGVGGIVLIALLSAISR
jgi:putative membrane protein